MAIVRRQFHSHERGMGDETWHYLARDTETGRVFILKETSRRVSGGLSEFSSGETEIELSEFLNGHGSTAKDKLLSMIATLVPEPDDA